MSSAAISQLSCFSSVTRRAQLRSRFSPSPALRPKVSSPLSFPGISVIFFAVKFCFSVIQLT
nr:protein FATTY ACID EXPORT 1, chloroplastic [Ipomoea batatas]GMD47999.1 protein FATTY ACID EXPORT 1, chloroplastic [Ipomoea batatas]GME03117.1 protein FATTY ACID EXPORT 1, chloroplastic [Ipomoea batatas]